MIDMFDIIATTAIALPDPEQEHKKTNDALMARLGATRDTTNAVIDCTLPAAMQRVMDELNEWPIDRK